MKLYTYFSIQYWKCHKKRLLLLSLTIMAAQAFLMCALFFDRSEKLATMEKEFYILGNYDFAIYDVDIQMFDRISHMGGMQLAGYYNRFGSAELAGKSGEYAACYFDQETSIDMFHMTCLKGEYPRNENQVAADFLTLKELGINPEPGTKIELTVFDNHGEEIAYEEYELSGVFAWKQEGILGGALRYPPYSEDMEYKMPVLVFHKGIQKYQGEETLCVFAKTTWDDVETRLLEVFANDFQRDEFFCQKLDSMMGRRYAYQYLLGIMVTIWEDYGDQRMSTIRQAIADGNIHMDVLSTAVIPAVLALVSLLAALTVGWIEDIVLDDRKDRIATMRSLGMPAAMVSRYLIYETLLILLVSVGMGYVLGMGLYQVSISILKRFFDITVYPAFKVDEIISLVTINPYIVPAVLISVIVILITAIKVISMNCKEPLELLTDEKKNKKRIHKISGQTIKKGWLPVLRKRLTYNNKVICFIFIITMTFAFAGYQFFVNMAKYKASEMDSSYAETFDAKEFQVSVPAKMQYDQMISMFYLLLILLILQGMVSIAVSLYFTVHMNMKKYAVLMAVGMEPVQIIRFILLQNIKFPVIGGLAALLFTGLGQVGLRFFHSRLELLSGNLSGSILNWWHIGMFDLFTGKWYLVWLLMVIVFMAMILLATLPQIRYLLQKSVLESIRQSEG